MHFDTIIRNGTVVDGSGAPAKAADVGIVGDRVQVVDKLNGASAAIEIDATGKVVAPGFIDVHVHSEIALLGGPGRYGGVLQGVTTQLTAPDGFGWAPLSRAQAQALWESTLFAYGASPVLFDTSSPEGYLSAFKDNTPANIVPQVPHCAVRFAVMGWEPRVATDDELEKMKKLVRQWAEAGAVCLNLGLDYQPSAFADLRELVELSKVMREYDGIYAAHIRYNDLGREAAWRETMEIGELADIPVHISHETVTDITEPLLEEAAKRCDLTFESYMYPAGCTHMAMMLPIWAQAGGPEGIRQRLRDPKAREAMRIHLERYLANGAQNGERAVFVSTQTGRFLGLCVQEAAQSVGMAPGEFALKVLEEENPYALMLYYRGGPPDLHLDYTRRTVRHPRMMVASDGIYHGSLLHPRGYGCFARVLRLCVRELQAVSLEEAIYKMSGFPAERFRIKDRGLLRPGYGADVVIFDPQTVADRSTWEQGRLEPVGIDRVIVNGKTVVEHGRPTGLLPGRVLQPLA